MGRPANGWVSWYRPQIWVKSGHFLAFAALLFSKVGQNGLLADFSGRPQSYDKVWALLGSKRDQTLS